MTTRAIENPSIIKNKIKRAEVNARRREIKAEVKKKLRLQRKKEEDENPELKEVCWMLIAYVIDRVGAPEKQRAENFG